MLQKLETETRATSWGPIVGRFEALKTWHPLTLRACNVLRYPLTRLSRDWSGYARHFGYLAEVLFEALRPTFGRVHKVGKGTIHGGLNLFFRPTVIEPILHDHCPVLRPASIRI